MLAVPMSVIGVSSENCKSTKILDEVLGLEKVIVLNENGKKRGLSEARRSYEDVSKIVGESENEFCFVEEGDIGLCKRVQKPKSVDYR